jgi:HAD superfamily hydrolase (TIGR01490 family)
MSDLAKLENKNRHVALFDMDHTVLRIDSSMSWMRFLKRRGELPRFYSARAAWWGMQYKLALLDIDSLADRLVAKLRGDSETEFADKVEEWYRTDACNEVAPAARSVIKLHQQRGDVVALLTGSNQYAAGVVARSLGIEHVLATKFEVVDGLFTGKVAQRCFGNHKISVAESWAAQNALCLDSATFYSDSYQDLPMLSRVAQPVAVNPDIRLRRHAHAQRWSVRSWF